MAKRKKRGKVSGIGAMSPTSKGLLLLGAGGIAAYLLWRFWPREEYPPADMPQRDVPQQQYGATEFQQQIPRQANPVMSEMQSASFIPGSCPPGEIYNEALGYCVPYVE